MREGKRNFALFQLLPNMLTLAAICAGLTAIRFAVEGRYEGAVLLILAACVLDGLDGRIARMLRVDSDMGAELDSLADFLNFGVAPPIVLYFWALQDMPRAGWIALLIFSVCCVIRLARFNVATKSEESTGPGKFFVGVPAPAGAMLVLLPMFLSFAFANAPLAPDPVLCAYMVFIGFLMISRIPTWSGKSMRISRENVKFFLVGFVFIGAAVLTYAWVTLAALTLVYAGLVVWGLVNRRSAERM